MLLRAAGAAALGGLLGRSAAQGGTRTVELVARRFLLRAGRDHAAAGEAVVVEIRSLDFVHGMYIPELGRGSTCCPAA